MINLETAALEPLPTAHALFQSIAVQRTTMVVNFIRRTLRGTNLEVFKVSLPSLPPSLFSARPLADPLSS